MLPADEKNWVKNLSDTEIENFTMLDIFDLEISDKNKRKLLRKRSKKNDPKGKECAKFLRDYYREIKERKWSYVNQETFHFYRNRWKQ